MKFTIGFIGTRSDVEVTNRQQHVEYKVISGHCSEEEVRAAVGNANKGLYSYYYDGYYGHRAEAVKRIESDIAQIESELETLRFALKVTKKKNWIKVD